jgi:hypothetical protein
MTEAHFARRVVSVPRVLLVVVLALPASAGCARPSGRTAEVHGPDGGRYYATVFHFLTAADDYDRASYVHDGESYREDMGRHLDGRPRRCHSANVTSWQSPALTCTTAPVGPAATGARGDPVLPDRLRHHAPPGRDPRRNWPWHLPRNSAMLGRAAEGAAPCKCTAPAGSSSP